MALRVGLIGTGWVARDRHLPTLHADPRVELVAVADHTAASAQRAAREFEVPHVFERLEHMLELPLDAVVVCTPPQSHFELVSAVLERRLHVLVEKPLTVGSMAAHELVARRERAGVTAAVSHNFLWSRSARRALARVRSGESGRVVAVHGLQLSSAGRRLPRWYPDLPGGLFYDEAPHLLYLLRAFAGELSLVHARARQVDSGRPQPIGYIEAAFEGEVAPANLSMNFESPVSEWLVTIACTNGVLIIDLFRDIFIELRSDRGHTAADVVRSSGSLWVQQLVEFARAGALFATRRLRYGHEQLISLFVQSALERQPSPVSFDDGERVVQLMDDILQRSGIRTADQFST